MRIARQNIDKICKNCGNKYIAKRITSHFCSRKCVNKYKYNDSKEDFVCDYCGNKFVANKYNVNRHEHKYCSKNCQMSAYWEENRNSHKVINGVVCKLCSTCNEWIPLNDFRKDVCLIPVLIVIELT